MLNLFQISSFWCKNRPVGFFKCWTNFSFSNFCFKNIWFSSRLSRTKLLALRIISLGSNILKACLSWAHLRTFADYYKVIFQTGRLNIDLKLELIFWNTFIFCLYERPVDCISDYLILHFPSCGHRVPEFLLVLTDPFETIFDNCLSIGFSSCSVHILFFLAHYFDFFFFFILFLSFFDFLFACSIFLGFFVQNSEHFFFVFGFAL